MTGDTAGGVWTFTLELADGLSRQGVEVLLATFGGSYSASQLADASSIPNLQLLGSNFKLEWMEDPWDDIEKAGRWLLELEASFKPDLIHLNTLAHGALRWQAPVLLTAHSCVSTWWRAVKGEALPANWSQYQALVETSLNAVDVLTTPSHALMNALRDSYQITVDADRCHVIANSRNPRLFHDRAKEPFVLTAGRLWDEAKNVAAVVRAAPHLLWPVWLAGDQRGPNGEGVETAGCVALGKLSTEELAGFYARASIYALPARYEPFGLSAVEAALSGCTLVLGDIPSLREVWGDAAVFVPPDDDAALAAIINLLIGDPDLRLRLAQRANDRARQFTTERMADGYISSYRQAAEVHAGSRKLACAV
ncbi:MAG: glycosyl transferase, group 1 [Bryobacterales bacterium]|nr:glycosyl transferase, group 1 [Bryobacterales bacterium]